LHSWVTPSEVTEDSSEAALAKKGSVMRIAFKFSLMVSNFLALVALVLFCGHSWAEEKDSLKRVMIAWQNRRDAIHTVRYRIKGNVVIPKGTYNGETELATAVKEDLPSKDYEYPQEISLLIDFAKNRVKLDVSRQLFHAELAEFKPYRGVSVFDGSKFTSSSLEDPNAIDAYVTPPELYKSVFFELDEYPVLLGHGILDSELTDPRDLLKSPNENEFIVLSHALCNNRECVIVRRTKPVGPKFADDYWVDMSRGSAVLRWQRYNGACLASSLDIDYQQTPQGWFPLSWTGSQFRYVTKLKRGETPPLQFTSHMRVTELLLNPDVSSEEMQFNLKPGMIVDVSAKDNAFHLYSVQPDGSLTPFIEHNSHRWLFAAIIGFSLCLIIISIFARWRSGKKAT
jgi:hypothetical protein